MDDTICAQSSALSHGITGEVCAVEQQKMNTLRTRPNTHVHIRAYISRLDHALHAGVQYWTSEALALLCRFCGILESLEMLV